MSIAKFKAVQKKGTYKTEKGETKTSYQEIGIIFENEKGHLSQKFNALPLPNEKGEVWLNLFPIKT